MKIKIKHNGDCYTVQTHTKRSISNYGTILRVFKLGEKTPICGYTINNIHSGKVDILNDLAIKLIEQYDHENNISH